MRPIDADAFLEDAIKSKRFVFSMYDAFNDQYVVETVYKDLAEALKAAPTIYAEPVRHGRWIDMQEDDATEGMWRCSECGSDRYFDIFTPEEAGCYYCPNCGAKMDEEVQG